jgi:hypothetical protein
MHDRVTLLLWWSLVDTRVGASRVREGLGVLSRRVVCFELFTFLLEHLGLHLLLLL